MLNELLTRYPVLEGTKDQIVEVVEQGTEGSAGNEFIQIQLNQHQKVQLFQFFQLLKEL